MPTLTGSHSDPITYAVVGVVDDTLANLNATEDLGAQARALAHLDQPFAGLTLRHRIDRPTVAIPKKGAGWNLQNI
jgi:hypothetical protein